jgi:hypothetical protein
MENFFNYLSKPIPNEDVDLWFRINNILPEKLELFSDFTLSLNFLIEETYLGETDSNIETKIKLSTEDNRKHFEWCFNKIISNFQKETINFKNKGEHFDYFKTFFEDVFYNQKEEQVRKSVNKFLIELFNVDKTFTKSDLDMLGIIYKILDRNLVK